MSDNDKPEPKSARLAASSYLSPYARHGAPRPHPNTDPYAPLRARALSTLEAMGFDADTMVEHGVLWAEHQDPFGHVMQAQFMSFMGASWIRALESYDEFLSPEELEGIMQAKTMAPMVRRLEVEIKRQVKYPDVVIAAYRHERMDPFSNGGTSVLFSLKQQAIVAQVTGTSMHVDVRTGRRRDIRTLGGGFPALLQGLVKKSEKARDLMEKWERDHLKPPKSKM
ncbi:hypothetical protein K4F52_001102 [Lecanicillium sp. MT-2017a]|nr:hypothetical protein K4F52_001102 [Lecanicillium sp. MT-2017a]